MNQSLFRKLKNLKSVVFLLLIPSCQIETAIGQTLTRPLPTRTPHFNWPIVEKGKVLMVDLKSRISQAERDRILKKMAAIGTVKNINGSQEAWALKVTNGMSAKSAYELIKTDSAVVYAAPVFSKDGEIPFPGPRPTPTHKPYPTPNWDRLVPGKDYAEGRITVGLKPNLSPADTEKAIRLMSSIGNVKHEVLQGLKMEYFVIQITNGMSVKNAVEKMKTNPSVDYAEQDAKMKFN